MLFNWVKKKFW